MKSVLVAVVLAAWLAPAEARHPRWTANGATRIWPTPQNVSSGSVARNLTADFAIHLTCSNTDTVLRDAASRYLGWLFWNGPTRGAGSLSSLQVCVNGPTTRLGLEVDESYELKVPVSGDATLNAKSVWGALRGLETFYALVDNFDEHSNSYEISNCPIAITDAPRFPWRGLLVDTARHFLPMPALYRAVDALAFSKMNVLHLHLVDAETFPFEVAAYPRLSSEGSFHPSAVYTPAALEKLVAYGYARGVRVVPEFDLPGHAHAWGYGYPDVVAQCPSYSANINNVPLTPANNLTEPMVKAVLQTAAGVFRDDYFHLGGDEVVTSCWREDPAIQKWMTQHNTDTTGVFTYFVRMAQNFVAESKKIPVHWQEVFEHNVPLPKDAIVQVWKDKTTIKALADVGLRSLLSFGWYLDKQLPDPKRTWYGSEETWKNYYLNDPIDGVGLRPDQIPLVLGGEATMWGECVDGQNMDSREWPRAGGVAERLWGPALHSEPSNAQFKLIGDRLTAQSCRMSRRGIMAGPLVPDTFCRMPAV